MGRSDVKVMSSSNKVHKNTQLFPEPAPCQGGLDFPEHSCTLLAIEMIQELELLANLLQTDDLITAYQFKKKRITTSEVAKRVAHPQLELNIYDVSGLEVMGRIIFYLDIFLSFGPEMMKHSHSIVIY